VSSRLVNVLPSPRPRLAAVGTARPQRRYEQQQLADLLAVPDGIGRRLFKSSGIATRYLYLEPDADCGIPEEDESLLLRRHRRGALELGQEAISRCLASAGMTPDDIDFLVCVSSTGMMLPALSAMYIRHVPFRDDCQRVDIVGMGCNAALNGLNTAANWAAVNRARNALVVCCEINSAIHVRDDRVVTSLVNSLFGDGCGAILLTSSDTPHAGPEILAFSSHLIPEAWRAISYHWSTTHNKFELYLDRDIPNLLGLHSPTPIAALLNAFQLERRDVKHWLVHAGGKKVISAIGEANGLTPHDLRHATSVLRESGNLGSATVMFSYEESLKESMFAEGDYGVMVTMGPGATIETALLQW
jgi:polyketide synthase Type III